MIYLLFGAGCCIASHRICATPSTCAFGKSLKNSIHPQPGGLTSFQSLCTSLAARVGSGNLAGVALAITASGPWSRLLDVGCRVYRHGDLVCRMFSGTTL
ncbi:alanine:cation symporter family protein [Escherichia coli]